MISAILGRLNFLTKISDNKIKIFISVLLLIIIVVLFLLPLFANIHNIRLQEDWLSFASWELFNIKSIREYHTFPLWCPFFGGGYPIIAYPEASIITPWIGLFLIFGEWEGLKLLVFLHVFIGALGMFYLTKKILGFTIFGSLFSSMVFILGGYTVSMIQWGLFTSMHFFYLPLLLALFIKSKENKLFFILCIVLVSIMLLRGALKFVVICFFILLFSFIDSFKLRQGKIRIEFSPLKRCLLIFVLAILLSMVKLLPIWELLTVTNRAFSNYLDTADEILNFKKFFYILFTPYTQMVDSDYYAYIGFFPIILGTIGLVLKKRMQFVFLLIIFLLLSFGPNSPFDLNKLLWHLPVFKSIGTPIAYYFPIVIFILCLLAGNFFSVFQKKKIPILLRVLIYLISLISILHVFLLHRGRLENIFAEKKPILYKKEHFYHTLLKEDDEDYPWDKLQLYCNITQDIGTINWERNLRLPENVIPKIIILSNGNKILNPYYQGEVFFQNKNNKVEILKFDINNIECKVNIREPDTLILNQNYYPGWRSDKGIVKSYNGLISIRLQQIGEYNVKFRYRPVSFYLGFMISLITFISLLNYCLVRNA